MGTMRAKFRVDSVTHYGDVDNPGTQRQYQLSAIHDGRTTDNIKFTRFTPYGDLKIRVDNPAAQLVVGDEYYLDFTACHQDEALATHAPEGVTGETFGNTHTTDVVDATRETDTDQVGTAGATTDAYARDHGTPRHAAPETSHGYATTEAHSER